jgi:PilZ domain
MATTNSNSENRFHDGFPFAKNKPQPAPAPAPLLPPLKAPEPTIDRPAAAAAAPAAPAPATVVPPHRERRRSPRQTLVAQAVIKPDVSVTVPALVTTGFVSNISMGGIGFHTRKPLAVGEKFRVNLELGPMKWSSRMKVVACTPHPKSGTFDVGAEFVGNDLQSRTVQVAA